MSAESTLRGRQAQGLARPASGAPLPELAEELLEDIRQFTLGAEQYDDQTFVLMRVGGENPGDRTRISLAGPLRPREGTVSVRAASEKTVPLALALVVLGLAGAAAAVPLPRARRDVTTSSGEATGPTTRRARTS